MNYIVIIPARYQANRLPGKPLADIHGRPLLQYTYQQARASGAGGVYVATDDRRIEEAAKGFGADVLMTGGAHRSGTDRIQEAARLLGLAEGQIIVNVQADEPLIPPAVIDQVAENLAVHTEAGIATLCEPITTQAEINDPSAVKVVFNKHGLALYFSRATIPYQASASAGNCYRHIGVYAYRVATLNAFVSWPVAELEVEEKLEQLRALYNGVAIHVAVSNEAIPAGVDTEKDLEAVRAYLAAH